MWSRSSSEPTEQGFTIVEIMVVILIIGVLAAVAVPAYLAQRKSAYEVVLKSDLRNVGNQIATTHEADSGVFKEPLPVLNLSAANPDPAKFEPVILSEGVSITFIGNSEGFCVTGSHDGDPTNMWGYSSSMGGLTKDVAGCVTGTPSGSTPAPTTPGRTGDIFKDEPLPDMCFPEMIEVNRLFNEFVTYRTPESMMSYVAYYQMSGYGSAYYNYHWNHIDTTTKWDIYDVLHAKESHIWNTPALDAEYDKRNTAMYEPYDYWREDEMLQWYQNILKEEIQKGANPMGTPTPRMREAFKEYVAYFHRWNYVQCGEYAYPGHPEHKMERPYSAPYTPLGYRGN